VVAGACGLQNLASPADAHLPGKAQVVDHFPSTRRP
jgi:hypothetical protein